VVGEYPAGEREYEAVETGESGVGRSAFIIWIVLFWV